MHPSHRKASARAAAAVAAAGLVAALTSAPATAQPAPATPTDSAVVPMNFVLNAYEVRDGQQARTFQKETRKVKKAAVAEGGVVLRSYPKIGVVVAQTEDEDFDDRLRAAEYSDIIQSLGATRTSPTSIPDLRESEQDLLRKALIEPEPMEDDQWGNEAVQSLEANEIQPGSPDVLVGVLDSGIDSDHEDLAAAIDHDASVDCTNNGVENTDEAAWNPTSSTHGTHVAGTVGARRNGIGVAGVAPGVTLASIKVVNDDGFIFPEYALCGFMWAPKHGVDVTNSSYYIDPWMFWCADDVEQGAVQESVRRAVDWADRKGIVNVASAGNSDMDLANKTVDTSSPNDSDPITRPIDENCLDMPTELPNVITVSSTDENGSKSSFSNYGDGIINVAAPGGNIVSTLWPSGYGSLSGTSMASPHVAGVAALTLSQHPDMTPEEVRAHVDATAVDVPCPAGSSECTGTDEYNGYFGEGLVNALNAVS